MRAEHLRDAYAVEVECVPDVPATTPMAADPFERWHELISRHAATFVALDGGRVVGYATLEHLYGQRHRLEHGLTAVLRSHRGRGVATRLKSAQIAWAAAPRLHGADHGHRHDESSDAAGERQARLRGASRLDRRRT